MTDSERHDASLLLAILNELPTGVWVARAPSGDLTYANRLFAEILGIGAREDVGAGEYVAAYGLFDRTGKPYPEDQLPFARALRERCTVVVDDIVIVRADGTRRHVRAFGKPLYGDGGEISQVMVAFIDISAEVASASERVATRERLRVAVHHAPIVLFTTDMHGVITLSEGAALAALGLTSGQLDGTSVFDTFPDNAEMQRSVKRALAGETFTSVLEQDGVVFETWMTPLRDEHGVQQGLIGVSTDITERLRLQRQMAHADRMSGLGRLAASVAHEINNPLSYTIEAVRLAGELAARAAARGTDDAGQDLMQLRRLLDDAAEGAERVRLITRDLKAFARPDEDARRSIELDQTIATAVKLVAKRTDTRAEVRVDLCSDAHVHADENRLVQIFVNLLLNAADALPGGTPQRHEIGISSRVDGKHALIEVSDNGPGVPDSLRERIFEPFFTTKAVGDGTGLGLYVTRNLISALAGTITVGAAPGGGAKFTVTLPLAVSPEPERKPSTKPPRDALRPRVMIIDDEPMLARVLRMTLEGECQVKTFDDARAALAELLSGEPYDVVFCDLMMSGVNGLELYEHLRAGAPGRERDVVFMTGGVFDPRIAEQLGALPNRVVDKPFDIRVEVWKQLASRNERG